MTKKKKIKLKETDLLEGNGDHASPEIMKAQKAASIEVARLIGLDDQQIEELLGVKIRPDQDNGNARTTECKKNDL